MLTTPSILSKGHFRLFKQSINCPRKYICIYIKIYFAFLFFHMDMICSGKYPQDTWCQWDPGSVQPCCLIVIGPYTPVYRCLRYSLDLLNFTSNSSFWLVFLSNFVCGPPSFPVVPQASWHPAGPAAVSKTFRRWAMPLGSSCRYLLALTCSVFSPGQAKEEETTSKEREQGSQSQR